MPKVVKLILVTAKHLPQHKYFMKILNALAKELNVEVEILEEDYEFLSKYGEKDEFGMAWAPQLFARLDDGSIIPILTKLPIDERLRVDTDKALNEARRRLQELTSG